MDDIKAGTQYIFQTKNAMTLALSATGHAGMECVMTNMLEPGRTILIANNGIWGVRWTLWFMFFFVSDYYSQHPLN